MGLTHRTRESRGHGDTETIRRKEKIKHSLRHRLSSSPRYRTCIAASPILPVKPQMHVKTAVVYH
ncbi:MAG: hypothetical protein HXY43_05120 [Fischerella sp.]|uniref:hypothetical protein n=1 Tax=Fischerella sp. TaxID=1191 RepID=UPI0017D4CF4D|nr:hypothetical protein [Fischerella sp.]NWF58696.1 hypothetical protein [Fischerella sp.]